MLTTGEPGGEGGGTGDFGRGDGGGADLGPAQFTVIGRFQQQEQQASRHHD